MGPRIDRLMEDLQTAVSAVEQQPSADSADIERISVFARTLLQTAMTPHEPLPVGEVKQAVNQYALLKPRIEALASTLYPQLHQCIDDCDAVQRQLLDDTAYLIAKETVPIPPRDVKVEETLRVLSQFSAQKFEDNVGVSRYHPGHSLQIVMDDFLTFVSEYQQDIPQNVYEACVPIYLRLQKVREWTHSLDVAHSLDQNGQSSFADRQLQETSAEIITEISQLKEGESLLIPGGVENNRFFYKITMTNAGILLEFPAGPQGALTATIPLNALQNSDLILNLMKDAIRAPYLDLVLDTLRSQPFWKEEMLSSVPSIIPTAFVAGMQHLKDNLPKPLFDAFQVYLTAQSAKNIYYHYYLESLQSGLDIERSAYEIVRQQVASLDKNAPGFENLANNVLNDLLFPDYPAYSQALLALNDHDLRTYEALLQSIPDMFTPNISAREIGRMHRQLLHAISRLNALGDQDLLQRYEKAKNQFANKIFPYLPKETASEKIEVAYSILPSLPSVSEESLGLAGHLQSLSINYLITELKNFLKNNEIPPKDAKKCHDAMSMLDQAKIWHEKIVNISHYASMDLGERPKEAMNELTEEILKKVRALKPGESLLMPGGSKYHAVLYYITRNSDGSLSLEIFNTGEGAMPLDVRGKTCSRVISPIPEADFDKNFLERLIEHSISTLNMNTVVQAIERQPFVTEQMIQMSQKKYPIQTRGTCSFDCVMAFLNFALQAPLYRLFQLDMTIANAKKINDVFQSFGPGAIDAFQHMATETKRLRAEALRIKSSRDSDYVRAKVKEKAKAMEEEERRKYNIKLVERYMGYARIRNITKEVLARV